MDENKNLLKKTEIKDHHLNNGLGEKVFYMALEALLPVVFFVGGIILLTSKLSGWSIFLGLPTTVMGIVFLIYSYDKAVTRNLEMKYKIKKTYKI